MTAPGLLVLLMDAVTMMATVLSTAEEGGFLLVKDTVTLVAAVLSTAEEELVQLCFLSRASCSLPRVRLFPGHAGGDCHGHGGEAGG